jgi:hypothetical protein
MVTKHFFKGLVAFMALIILGLVVFFMVDNSDKGVTAGKEADNKESLAK